MSFIDAHAHLTFEESATLPERLTRATNVNIEAIINVCTSSDDLQRALLLTQSSLTPKIYLAAAVTPHDVAKDNDAFFAAIVMACKNNLLVAVGETGLDYYYQHAPKEAQIASLRRHRDVAIQYQLPLVIHCRDAFEDLCLILDEVKQPLNVMLHCFTGTLEEAKQAIERGWYISFSGIVTFAKSQALQEVAKWVPLDHLLLETDSPYLAPQGYRGQTNEPSFIVVTAHKIAELKGISVAEVALQTTQNVRRLFHGIS